MHFGENQLSPHSIGISPLSTPHRNGFYPEPVRASRRCYTPFTLGMDRSCGFGSHASDLSPSSDLGFPSAPALQRLNLATDVNSLAHSSIGMHSQSLRSGCTPRGHTVSGSISLPSPGSFSPFPHGTSALSVTWSV